VLAHAPRQLGSWLTWDVGRKMTLLRKYPKAVAICVLLVCAGAVFLLLGREPSDIRYFERISGVSFPRGISELQIIRPREFCFSGRLRIPKDREEAFLKSSDFRPSSDFPLNASLGLDSAKFSTPDGRKGWYGLVGRSSKDRWELAYNPSDQDLWFVMLFEDAHGDPSP